MNQHLPSFILGAGIGQLAVLIASAMVPFQLDWRKELRVLSRLHRQMYVVYGGYIVLSIVAFGVISLMYPAELASGSSLARAFCLYMALFWGIRLGLQPIFDAKPHLTSWWLKLGYHALTVLFAGLTGVYFWAAFRTLE